MTNKNETLCVYHGGCDDGFAAAYVVREAIGHHGVDYYSARYDQVISEELIVGRDLIFVDFSYKRPVMEALSQQARSILVIDHHKTAEAELAGIPRPANVTWDLSKDGLGAKHASNLNAGEQNMYAVFDMVKSGATLAWDYFFSGRIVPLFLQYVEDRDLWKKSFTLGDLFTAGLRSYPQEFTVWDAMFRNDGEPNLDKRFPHKKVEALIYEGACIERYYSLRVDEIKRCAYPAYFPDGGNVDAWVCNAPYFVASDLAGQLAAEHPEAKFAACYFEVAPGRYQYSLRSRGDFDVSEVAKMYGGGGHKNAAGFTAELSHVWVKCLRNAP